MGEEGRGGEGRGRREGRGELLHSDVTGVIGKVVHWLTNTQGVG